MFSVVSEVDINRLRAVLWSFGMRPRLGRFPVPFLHFLCHYDTDRPTTLATSVCSLSHVLPSCIPPRLFDSCLFCGLGTRLAVKYGNAKSILFLVLLERLRYLFRNARRTVCTRGTETRYFTRPCDVTVRASTRYLEASLLGVGGDERRSIWRRKHRNFRRNPFMFPVKPWDRPSMKGQILAEYDHKLDSNHWCQRTQ